eukprot:387418-Rhodomonas_salina.1
MGGNMCTQRGSLPAAFGSTCCERDADMVSGSSEETTFWLGVATMAFCASARLLTRCPELT